MPDLRRGVPDESTAPYLQAARGEVWRGICGVPFLAVTTVITVITLVDVLRSDWMPTSPFASWDGRMDKWSAGTVLIICVLGFNGMLGPLTVARLRLRSSLRTWRPESAPTLRGTVTERRWFRVIVDVATTPGSDAPGRRLTLPRDSRRLHELRPGDPVVVEGLIRPGSWVAVTTPDGLAWARLLPRRVWRLTSM